MFRTLATTHLVDEILLGLIIGATFLLLDLRASEKVGEFHQVRIQIKRLEQYQATEDHIFKKDISVEPSYSP